MGIFKSYVQIGNLNIGNQEKTTIKYYNERKHTISKINKTSASIPILKEYKSLWNLQWIVIRIGISKRVNKGVFFPFNWKVMKKKGCVLFLIGREPYQFVFILQAVFILQGLCWVGMAVTLCPVKSKVFT